MFADLVRHSILCFLALDVWSVSALPTLPQPYNALGSPLLYASQDTAEKASITKRMDGTVSAVLAADIPTATQQSQDITSTEGMIGTHPQPGVIPNLSITREEVNCTDLSTGRDNKCWQELQLTNWVEDWIVGNTCYEDEAFASCFLRKVGYPELDCTGIKLATCTPPPLKPDMDPRVFYVAYNIYGLPLLTTPTVNQYFGSWYSAIGGASNLAALNVEEIVQLINPPDTTNLIMDNILIALTGIFAVAPGLGFNVGNALDNIVEESTEVAKSLRLGLTFIENAIIGFPQIGRFLYPIDTEASQLVQIADLKGRLGDLIGTVQGNLNKTIVSVMADPTEFLAFAAQGNFTASAPSLPDQQQYLLYGFNTYIISTCLAGNNIHATVALDTNVQALATNGSQESLNFDLPAACAGYTPENVCGPWWFSGNYGATFALDHFDHMERSYGDLMTRLFRQYTTGQLLFDNAYACNRNGNFGQPVNVTVNAGGLNTQCLSQLQVLTWDMSCDGVRDRACEFVEGEAQDGFLGNCGSKSFFSVMDEPVYCVPNGYLGPLVFRREYRLDRG
ncbi:MAG: hypothetical protein Q9219_003142 [cf. Caloplaca sp. 3 TL-2023]